MLDGVLCVDKPRGKTSHDVVAIVRRLTGMRSVGHTGTLDPDASGLLVLCLGRATKFARFFEALDKTYWTVMRLGVSTDTQDATGTVVQQQPVAPISRPHLQRIIAQFTGCLWQTPPMYSALKHHGQRLYELARRGQTVPRQARQIVVHRLEVLDIRQVWVTLSVMCSKGTYIRTLCADIGQALGCGAHMVHLQRCRVGPFGLTRAHSLDALHARARQGRMASAVLPLGCALRFLPRLSLTAGQYVELQHGQGRGAVALLTALPGFARDVRSYRLHTPEVGTFAVLYRHQAVVDAETWKVAHFDRVPFRQEGPICTLTS